MKSMDFASAPEVVAEDGWTITDGGQERETADEIREALAPEATDAPAAESAAPDTEDTDQGSDDGNERQAAPAKRDEAPAPKPKRTAASRVAELQDEISRHTRTKHDTLREVTAAEARLRELEAKLAAAESKAAGTAPETPAQTATPATDGTLKRPVWKDYESQGKEWDDFLADQEAYLDAKIEQSTGVVKTQFEAQLRELQERSQDQVAETRVSAQHQARMAVVKASHPDFADAMAAIKTVPQSDFLRDVVRMHPSGGEFLYQLGKHPEEAAIIASLDLSVTMFDAAMRTDDPSALLLHLARESDEFAEIRSMPSAEQAFALGALSARLSSSPAPRASGSRGSGTSVSKAAAPIRPVGTHSKAQEPDADGDESEDYADWFARENDRDAKRRGLGA